MCKATFLYYVLATLYSLDLPFPSHRPPNSLFFHAALQFSLIFKMVFSSDVIFSKSFHIYCLTNHHSKCTSDFAFQQCEELCMCVIVYMVHVFCCLIFLDIPLQPLYLRL